MSRQDTKDLLKFLKPFDEDVKVTVLWLRDFIWTKYPKANELIYDNYNAVAFGWSPTDKLGHVFCSIAVYRTNNNIHFGFYWGSQIKDPEKRLLGSGHQYRYILVKNKKDFPKAYIEKLMQEAFVNSMAKVKDPKQIIQGKTITKSVSPKKRELSRNPKAKN